MITTNTFTLSSYDKAADEILALIDDLGFTTDRAFDSLELRRKIVWSIISNASNKAPDEIVNVEVLSQEEQEPTDEDLEQMLAEMAEEDSEEQGNFYNTCPHCGQLVK